MAFVLYAKLPQSLAYMCWKDSTSARTGALFTDILMDYSIFLFGATPARASTVHSLYKCQTATGLQKQAMTCAPTVRLLVDMKSA